ncbi:SpoVA/SpoVAEb family sporulation membrane protein [Solibaculum intestinale]|uniref:SpoVA/SpoVAEb family sporulation membrane protein n=1 Tax=Solibaculum intestinale TaxID=3133165 RepID=A0ABV1DXA7_9FIRM
MNLTQNEYSNMTDKASPPSKFLRNSILAFVVGGAICVIGQALINLWSMVLPLDDAKIAASCSLIFLSALFTALGLYCKLATYAGAGTLVPITGFANSIAAAAIEFKSEGLILGTGVKMFIIAGPVLVYGPVAAVLYGILAWLLRLFV